MPAEKKSYVETLKNILFKPRPGDMAAAADDSKLSSRQKKKIKEFTDSFSGKKEKEKPKKGGY